MFLSAFLLRDLRPKKTIESSLMRSLNEHMSMREEKCLPKCVFLTRSWERPHHLNQYFEFKLAIELLPLRQETLVNRCFSTRLVKYTILWISMHMNELGYMSHCHMSQAHHCFRMSCLVFGFWSLIAVGRSRSYAWASKCSTSCIFPRKHKREIEMSSVAGIFGDSSSLPIATFRWTGWKEVTSMWWTGLCLLFSAGSGSQELNGCHTRPTCIPPDYFL